MKIVVSLTSLFASGLAFAHHPLNGMPMETFLHGVLSGIGHPLLGSDHLAFILLVGLVAFGLGVRDKIPGPERICFWVDSGLNGRLFRYWRFLCRARCNVIDPIARRLCSCRLDSADVV